MDNPAWSAVYFGWAFVIALGTRVAFTRLFRRPLGLLAQPAAYAMWVPLVGAGLFFIDLTGFVFYGYDHSNVAQRIGYYLFWFSPFGVPTILGAPPVLLFDLVLTIWKRFSRSPARTPSQPGFDAGDSGQSSPKSDLHQLLSDARLWLAEQSEPQEGSASWYGLNNFRVFIASLETDPTASSIERACHALGWHVSDQFEAYKELPAISQFNDRARRIAKALRRNA